MTRPVLVPIGMSGNCLELFEALVADYRVPAILDDAERHRGASLEGIPILPLSAVSRYHDARFLCLIGSPASYRARAAIIAGTGLPPERFARFVHPEARVSRFAALGPGVALYSGALVTSNARIGAHVLILPRAIVHHDVVIGDHSLIGAGAILAGGVEVGEGCYIGSGSAIRGGIRIGAGALVGLGSVVVRDVEPGTIVAGNPARPLRGAAG